MLLNIFAVFVGIKLNKNKMAKRFTSTDIWSEDWFLDMPNDYKLFWYYVLSNCDHAGIFKVNLRSFCGLLGVKIDAVKALEYFNTGKDRIREINQTLWLIEDFFCYQYGQNYNPNNRVHKSISDIYIKFGVKLTSIRGLIDLTDGVKDKDKDKDKDKYNGIKIKKGVKIENEKVYFDDGSFQELGKDQKALYTDGRIKPSDITKGLIN
jgi:hypothetical protein